MLANDYLILLLGSGALLIWHKHKYPIHNVLILIFVSDSAYTERYMGLPNVTDNYKGYEEADVSRKVSLLKDKMLYLVHGSADDNVHLQQSMALVRALAESGTLFRQQVYMNYVYSYCYYLFISL